MSAEPLTPESPVSFGHKCGWLAIQADGPEQVVASLALTNVRPATWREGIEAGYQGEVFVTPRLGGWLLATSTAFPEARDARQTDICTSWLLRLGQQFHEVQFFATHRVVEYHAWARRLLEAMTGSVRRIGP